MFRSSVTVFFKDDDIFYSKRSELFTLTDFIANVGGLLGLFLGISALSFVEIFYFTLFRHLRSEPQKAIPDTSSVTTIDIESDARSNTTSKFEDFQHAF